MANRALLLELTTMVSTHGYSGKPLFQKLGMKPGGLWKLVRAPGNYFELLGPVEEVVFSKRTHDLDGIHIFTKTSREVELALNKYSKQIKPDGMLWFSWYKKSSRIPTDVTEDVIRDTALTFGLVDVKVCAVSEIWSGLKIVWRKENRK